MRGAHEREAQAGGTAGDEDPSARQGIMLE
jgi:hypothetical protein